MQVVVGVGLIFFVVGFLVGFAWVFRLKNSFKSVGVDEIPAPLPSPFSRGSGWIHRIWFHEMRFHWSWLSAAGRGSFWLSLSSPLYLPGLNHLLLPLVPVLSPFRLLWAVLACHFDQNQTKIFYNVLQSCWIKVTHRVLTSFKAIGEGIGGTTQKWWG